MLRWEIPRCPLTSMFLYRLEELSECFRHWTLVVHQVKLPPCVLEGQYLLAYGPLEVLVKAQCKKVSIPVSQSGHRSLYYFGILRKTSDSVVRVRDSCMLIFIRKRGGKRKKKKNYKICSQDD